MSDLLLIGSEADMCLYVNDAFILVNGGNITQLKIKLQRARIKL